MILKQSVKTVKAMLKKYSVKQPIEQATARKTILHEMAIKGIYTQSCDLRLGGRVSQI